MDIKPWNKHRFRARVLNRLIDGGGGSITRIVTGANLNSERGRPLIREMAKDGLIKLTPMGRMNRVSITPMGTRYMSEFNRFCGIIETLKSGDG